MRLDAFLTERGLVDSRTKAQSLIKKGTVFVDGALADKCSMEIAPDLEVGRIKISQTPFVSRAGEKLDGFLASFYSAGGSIKGKIALDVGSSAGGFTQVLLREGALKVVCVDVGSAQLDAKLRENAKIFLFENTDIRAFKGIWSGAKFSLVTCDVSFISLSQILESLSSLCASGADLVLLFKPQFEVGINAKRNKKGVVLDSNAIERRFSEFLGELEAFRFQVLTTQKSKIFGKEGNNEIFIHARFLG